MRHPKCGAGGRNRTDTLSPELDFESSASTSSATPAYRIPEHSSRSAPILHLALFAPPRPVLTYSPNPPISNDFHFVVKNRRMVDKTLFESDASTSSAIGARVQADGRRYRTWRGAGSARRASVAAGRRGSSDRRHNRQVLCVEASCVRGSLACGEVLPVAKSCAWTGRRGMRKAPATDRGS